MENQNLPIDKTKRLISMVVDYFLMSAIVAFIAMFSLATPEGAGANHDVFTGKVNLGMLSYLGAIGIALLLCKDSFNGQSVGKRMFNFQVMDDASGEVASPMKCLVRNLTYPLSIIEFIITYFKPEKRLGDMIAKTSIVNFDDNRKGGETDIGKLAMPFLLAFALGALYLHFTTSNLTTKNDLKPIAFSQSSENQTLATETAQLFTNKYGNILTADVKVYDQVEGSPDLQYVSVILDLNDNHKDSYPNFEAFKNESYALLLTKFPLGSFVGQMKFIEPNDGKDRVRILPLDWRK